MLSQGYSDCCAVSLGFEVDGVPGCGVAAAAAAAVAVAADRDQSLRSASRFSALVVSSPFCVPRAVIDLGIDVSTAITNE